MQEPTTGKVENHHYKPLRLTKQIGQTTYKVNVHFSETSNQTIGDKIIHLIENEAANRC